jgi:endo-1,4-beta-D-glucanase Y
MDLNAQRNGSHRNARELQVKGCILRSWHYTRALGLIPQRRERPSLRIGLLLLACAAAGGCQAGPDHPQNARIALLASTASPAEAGHRRAYSCGQVLAPDQAKADLELRNSYASWRKAYVTAEGARGLLRVKGGEEHEGATPSEGIGYGMLLAAYLDDKHTFDRLWAYAKRYRNARGMMAWLIPPDGASPGGAGAAATDADEDMAFALIVADTRWGGYRTETVALIHTLMRRAVEPGTYVLKPGDIWGGSEVTNPSYFAPAYYKAFAAYTGDPRWLRVADTSYRILANVDARHGGTGLQPDWTTAAGDPVRTAPDRPFRYGYDATRVPWRLAKDAVWNCDPRAMRHLARINRFFQGIGAEEIRDGYALNGRRISHSHHAAFVAPVAAGALIASDSAYRRSLWKETVRLRNSGYYGDSLRLLSLLLASGNMPPPRFRAPASRPLGSNRFLPHQARSTQRSYMGESEAAEPP